MKIAWFECATGISGDMTLAALIDAGVDSDKIRQAIASLNLPDVRLRVESVMKGGFRATQVLVDHPEQHAHRHYSDICRILEKADLTDRQRQLADRMFLAVAESEARVHGSTLEKIHFHEVGAIDSIVDIVGTAVAIDLLNVDRIVCNRIPTGRGFVNIDHGICPIPAPGTAEILKGIPLADIPIEAELTTPTGAAIVKTCADSFGSLPAMTIEQIGYGTGTMTFPERANILRVFVGEAVSDPNSEYICLLETNLDDTTGEIIGHCSERLLAVGALDVTSTAIQMKKNRPGITLSVLCRPESADECEHIIYQETRTLGIRRNIVERRVRSREMVQVNTPWGQIAGKVSLLPNGDTSFSPEFEDCAQLARQNKIPLIDVYRAAEYAYSAPQTKVSHSAQGDHHHDHDGHYHDHDGHDHDGHDHDGHDHESH